MFVSYCILINLISDILLIVHCPALTWCCTSTTWSIIYWQNFTFPDKSFIWTRPQYGRHIKRSNSCSRTNAIPSISATKNFLSASKNAVITDCCEGCHLWCDQKHLVVSVTFDINTIWSHHIVSMTFLMVIIQTTVQ